MRPNSENPTFVRRPLSQGWWRGVCLSWLFFACVLPQVALSQLQAPLYEECRLDSIFPLGGQRGTTVKVEFKGFGSGMSAPKEIVVDGAPGITVKELKSVNGGTAEALLEIAADAPPGRRLLRVLNERSGLTNFAQFVVSSLPEQQETEPNNDVAKAEKVAAPIVINGRINPAADLDVFRFTGKAGQKFVAAIAAHAIDVHGQGRNFGIADFSLELLDTQGRTLASAEDTLGFDPLIEQVLPADGDYLVRVQLLNFGGFPEAAYRLTLGEVPYPIGVFPAGWRRGTEAEVELFGPNIAAGSKVKVSDLPVAGDGKAQTLDAGYPLRHLTTAAPLSPGIDVPLVVGNLPESIESEPNDERIAAPALAWPTTVNGRFQKPEDADWFKVKLESGQKVWFEVLAQQFLRSPVDTLLQVYDDKGMLLVENDDDTAAVSGYESLHDFNTTDSKLMFTAPASGVFFVKLSEQSGVSGPRAIYRLQVDEARPDFTLRHFPDGVPVWGPGSTACVLVRFDRFAGFQGDIEAAVEGLPAGWTSRAAVSLGQTPQRVYNNYQIKVFLTITAPADAVPGTCVPFRIVGRSKLADGTMLERASTPLTLMYTSDTGFFRASPISRAAVAKPQGPWLEPMTNELKMTPGGTTTITVRVHGAPDLKEMPTVVNLATNGVACGLMTPQNLPITDGKITVPFKLPDEMPIGQFGVTVAQTWRGDIRIGMPGPCTPLIPLTVIPK